jgi:hypothetical protein
MLKPGYLSIEDRLLRSKERVRLEQVKKNTKPVKKPKRRKKRKVARVKPSQAIAFKKMKQRCNNLMMLVDKRNSQIFSILSILRERKNAMKLIVSIQRAIDGTGLKLDEIDILVNMQDNLIFSAREVSKVPLRSLVFKKYVNKVIVKGKPTYVILPKGRLMIVEFYKMIKDELKNSFILEALKGIV